MKIFAIYHQRHGVRFQGKNCSKVTPLIKNALKDWVFNHDHIPICELHSDLIEPAQDGSLAEACNGIGRVRMSDSNLQKLIPPNIKPMSKQRKILCGCMICIPADNLQHPINTRRTKHLK
eukprot:9380390-Ditylum_brightwellii.AAC.1